jgi:segregation and condensation protein B
MIPGMGAKPDPTTSLPAQEGISLQELSEAFAQVTGDRMYPSGVNCTPPKQGEGDGAAIDSGTSPGDSDVAEHDPDPGIPPIAAAGAPDNDPCEINPLSVLEAMLFVGNQASGPLTVARAAELMRGVEPGEIAGLVDQLNRRYAARGCPYYVVSEGAGYRLTLRREFWPIRNRFYGRIREARLSQAAVETLAVVAYRQPVTAEQVSQLRTRPAGPILGQLVRRRLLRVERTPENPRIARYYTTERFLDLFGLNSLGDLPRSDDDADVK